MTQKSRIEIPSDMAAQVLFESDRTCCVCRKLGRPVQIHHIDENPANNAADNLAVLCFECHRETQIRGGFDRKLNAAQIILYMTDWLSRVALKRDKEHGPTRPERPCLGSTRALSFMQMRETSEEFLYSFAVDYPQVKTGDPTADAETNLLILSLVTLTLQRFRATAIARGPEKCEMKKESSLAWDDLSISHKVALYTPELLSIEFELWSYYAMAVHPNTHTRTLNFRLHPSFKLELNDVFQPSSDYLELLSEYCVKDLHNQQPLRFHDPAERVTQLKEKQDGWILSGAAPNYSNYERFVLVKGGVLVFFDPYQVGSYAEGRYEVFIPRHVLAPALDESMAVLLG